MSRRRRSPPPPVKGFPETGLVTLKVRVAALDEMISKLQQERDGLLEAVNRTIEVLLEWMEKQPGIDEITALSLELGRAYGTRGGRR